MRLGRVFLGLCLALLLVGVGIFFSKHGLWELRSLRGHVEAGRVICAQLEEENRLLRRQLDLLSKPSPTLLDRVMRDHFGFVRGDELVFFESLPRNGKTF